MEHLTPDHVLLGLLAARSTHGYQLLDVFRQPHQLGRVWNLSTSQLYAVLKRLEQKGWIIGRAVTTSDAPTRTQYTLTALGQQQLDSWLFEPMPSPSIRRVRVEFLSRLYVAHQLNISVKPIITAQRKTCAAQHRALIEEQAGSLAGVGALAVGLVIAQLEALLQWIDRCEMALKKPEHTRGDRS